MSQKKKLAARLVLVFLVAALTALVAFGGWLAVVAGLATASLTAGLELLGPTSDVGVQWGAMSARVRLMIRTGLVFVSAAGTAFAAFGGGVAVAAGAIVAGVTAVLELLGPSSDAGVQWTTNDA